RQISATRVTPTAHPIPVRDRRAAFYSDRCRFFPQRQGMRALVAVLALSLTIAALAATPQVEAAVKAFQSLASDANRLKTFCELIEIEQENEEKAGPLLATKMDNMLDELG